MINGPEAACSEPYNINWPEAFDFMNQVEDPQVRCLLRLVYGQFVQSELRNEKAAMPFDLLFCFRILFEAFSCKPGLANALNGEYGEQPIDGWS